MSSTSSNGHAAPTSNGDRAADLLEQADALMERARTLTSQADQLIAALDEAARHLVESGQGVKGAPLRVPISLRKPSEANGPAEPNRTAGAKGPKKANRSKGSVSAAAKLFISQMAVDGVSREEIAERLREDFGVTDPDEVLDRLGL